MIDPDADPTLIGNDIVDAIGGHLAEFRVDKIIDTNLLGGALGLPFPSAIFEVANWLLFLGVDGDHRIAGGLVLCDHASDIMELGVPVRMLPAFPGLAC